MGRAQGENPNALLPRRASAAPAEIEAVRKWATRATYFSEHEQTRIERGEELEDIDTLLERSSHPLASQEGQASCHPRFSFAGLTALEPDEWYRAGDHRNAMGRIVDERGEQVGQYGWAVSIDEADELRAHISAAHFNPQLRNRGFMRAYTNMVEERYRSLGADYLTVNACAVGGYTWADTGFFFDPRVIGVEHRRLSSPAEADERVLGQVRALLDNWWLDECLRRGQISEQLYDHVEALIPKQGEPLHPQTPLTPLAIAQLGKDEPHWFDTVEEVEGVEMWLGKRLLVGTFWSGIKPLH